LKQLWARRINLFDPCSINAVNGFGRGKKTTRYFGSLDIEIYLWKSLEMNVGKPRGWSWHDQGRVFVSLECWCRWRGKVSGVETLESTVIPPYMKLSLIVA
jgi:hypothetical protein